jgi:hypothetical protein
MGVNTLSAHTRHDLVVALNAAKIHRNWIEVDGLLGPTTKETMTLNNFLQIVC